MASSKGFEKNFPGFPTTKAQFYLRLVMIVYLFTLMLLILSVHPAKKATNISSLILQFGNAAVLWWESVTKSENIDVTGNEVQAFDMRRPSTKLEMILFYIFVKALSIILFFIPVTVISIRVWVLSASDGIQNALKLQLLIWSSGIALFFFVQFVGKSADTYLSRTSLKIKNSGSDLETKRTHSRQAMRSIAFAMFSVGTLIQIGLACLS